MLFSQPPRGQVREDLEKQVEDFSTRLSMLELDLRTAREEMRGLKEDTKAAQRQAGALEIAKVIGGHCIPLSRWRPLYTSNEFLPQETNDDEIIHYVSRRRERDRFAFMQAAIGI